MLTSLNKDETAVVGCDFPGRYRCAQVLGTSHTVDLLVFSSLLSFGLVTSKVPDGNSS